MARRIRSLLRSHHRRPPKRKFILVCEGRNTEPEYFRTLKQKFESALIEIETIPGVGVPAAIASRAIEEKTRRGLSRNRRRKRDSFEEADQVWAVFDRDDHPRYGESAEKCVASGIGVAASKPCFELWLTLHLEDFNRQDDSNAVQRHLASICPEYDPRGRKILNFDALLASLEEAENRADRQLKARAREGDPFGRPSTTVFKLTREIRKAAEAAKR